MNHLYRIAIDPEVPLEDRYAALRIMKVIQVTAPRNYLKLQKRAAKQSEYNAKRVDWRYCKQA